MSAAIRTSSLTLAGAGDKSLSSMEKHGKRQDHTSQARKVRDLEPLVYGSLDLREAFDKHVEGCKMSKALKRPVLHSLVQFPKSIAVTSHNQQKMLDLAVKFINDTHGGDAVFAARLDRDESGQHTVDVFYSPKYEKQTKSQGSVTWISTTKHGKELCHVHREEIEARNAAGKFVTNPRAVGIAIQTEFRAFLMARGLHLEPKVPKTKAGSDRLSPEQYKIEQEYLKNKALKKQNAAFRRTLSMLKESLEGAQDLIPTKVWAVLSAVHKRLGTSHSPRSNRVDRDPSAARDRASSPQNPEPSGHAPAPLGR